MSRALGITLIATATIIAVLAALAQVAGRVTVALAPALEDTVNEALADMDVEVEGLSGRWHGFGPGFHADRLRASWGELEDLEFDLDLTESLGRNRIVARRLKVGGGVVALERADEGWRLKGATGPLPLDTTALALHSDAVNAEFDIVLHDAGEVGTLGRLTVRLANEGDRHRFSVRVRPPDGCPACELLVDGDIGAGGGGHARLAVSKFEPGSAVAAMFGLSDAELNGAGVMRADADGTRAELTASITGVTTPGRPIHLDARAVAWNDGGGYRGRLERLDVAAGTESMAVDAGFAVQGGAVEAWLAEVDLARIQRVGGTALGTHRLGTWLRSLAPSGRLRDVRLRFDGGGATATARGDGIGLVSYGGAPDVRDTDADLAVHVASGRTVVQATVAGAVDVAFTEHFGKAWRHANAAGTLTFWADGRYLGVRGSGLAVVEDGLEASGGFAISHPGDPAEARITVDAAAARADFGAVRAFVPRNLPPAASAWLRKAPLAGTLRNGRVLFYTHTRHPPGLVSRRLEIAADVEDATVRYHADWPLAEEVAGSFTVAPDGVRVTGDGRVFGSRFERARVHVPPDGGTAAVSFAARTDAARALDFARQTPVRDVVPFLDDAWAASGPLAIAADLVIPLDGVAEPDYRLRFELLGTDLTPGIPGLAFGGLEGSLGYRSPFALDAGAITGDLFGEPVRVAIESGGSGAAQEIRFDVAGRAGVAELGRLTGVDPPSFARGGVRFEAAYSIFPAAERADELALASDLEGLGLDLPAPLGKAPEAASAVAVTMHLLDAYSAVNVRYGVPESPALTGWIHVADDRLVRGALGIGEPAPIADADTDRVVVRGAIDELALAPDLVADLPDWEARNLRIGRLLVDEFVLNDVAVSAHASAGGTTVSVVSRELDGTFARQGSDPWRVDLVKIRLPEDESDADEDPLSVDIMDRLADADVAIGELRIGDEDFGSWQFGLRRRAEGLALTGLRARIRGLEVVADAPMVWSADTDTTHFAGSVTAGDLAEVLPRWGIAPSVESEAMTTRGSLSWPGSPMMFDLDHLTGDVDLRVESGRFVDVEAAGTGAMRIMSLINFWTIAKRLNLDFSDVFGEGVGFDEVRMELALDDGLVRFAEPARIDGTGSSFAINGTVDLETGELDNEMIVTLPLHEGLPWYAAFIALANPPGAVGVLVGRQLLKDEIKRLASLRYRISGTYDEPNTELVAMFENDIEGTTADPAPDGGASREAGDADGPAADAGVSGRPDAGLMPGPAASGLPNHTAHTGDLK